jgi:hypothetical protein
MAARVFVPGRPFQPSIMFVGNARSLFLSGMWLHSSRLHSLTPDIRQGWKGLPGTNTLAY